MKKDTAIVFSFDNLNQIFLTELVLNTINLTENIDFLFIVRKGLEEDDKLKALSIKFSAKILTFPNNTVPGKFFWYYTPFLTNHTNFLCVDNDLIFKNIDINNLFKKYKKKLKKKCFLGVRGHVWRIEKKKQIIKSYRKNYFDYVTKINKYINTGVVLMNGNKMREKYSYNKIEKLVLKYIHDMQIRKENIMDQEFMSINFFKDISYISNRYNLRLKYPFYLNLFSQKDNVIFHFNLWRWMGSHYKKYDIENQIRSNDFEKAYDYLLYFWSANYKYKMSKKTRNSLEIFLRFAIYSFNKMEDS